MLLEPHSQCGALWSHWQLLPQMQNSGYGEGLRELVRRHLVGLVVSESHAAHWTTGSRSQQSCTRCALQSRTESRTKKRICPLICVGASAKGLWAGAVAAKKVFGVPQQQL